MGLKGLGENILALLIRYKGKGIKNTNNIMECFVWIMRKRERIVKHRHGSCAGRRKESRQRAGCREIHCVFVPFIFAVLPDVTKGPT